MPTSKRGIQSVSVSVHMFATITTQYTAQQNK